MQRDVETKEKLNKFIRENHDFVREYFLCYLRRYREDDFKELLRLLFVDSLNARGYRKIGQKPESVKLFEQKIGGMKEPSYKELLGVFNAKDYNSLFDAVDEFKEIGPKGAALFLRNILYFGTIFQDVPSDIQKRLCVPVERVIIRTINSLFSAQYKAGNKTFNKINDIAKEIFPTEPILLEDLWFWQRLYRCPEKNVQEKQNITYCKFNENLMVMDTFITKQFRERILDLGKTHSDCPFKEVCRNPCKA